MSNQQTIPMRQIDKPRVSLRPVRRNSPEYVELVESIAKDGILQPILVRPVKDRYEIVEGFHRFEAGKEAGLVEMPCMVKKMTNLEVLVAQIKCNAIRPPTRSFEYARRLKLLMEHGISMPQLAALIDKTPKWIQDQLQLNRLCEEARPAFKRGEMSMSSALALANLPTDLQSKFVDDATAMKTREFVDRAKGALRDYKAYLLRQQSKDLEIGATVPTPRAINVIKREALKPKYYKEVLKASEAETPLDGWVACLQWVLKIDPVSVKNRKTARQEKDSEVRANRDEWRKLNRDLITKFVTPEIGDRNE